MISQHNVSIVVNDLSTPYGQVRGESAENYQLQPVRNNMLVPVKNSYKGNNRELVRYRSVDSQNQLRAILAEEKRNPKIKISRTNSMNQTKFEETLQQ